MESFKSSASSSSSVQSKRWTYDVFLSFRGEDTRNSFVDHLYTALVQKGIHAFKDDEMLCRGKPISPELLKAIEESKVAVVIFSRNFANSSWCLDELVKIMECQDQVKVLPVFYHVDPSDVRGQKRDFAAAFQKQHDKFDKWKKALAAAANLSGYHISAVSGGESAFIKKIVQDIFGNMQPRGRFNNLIGIESRMDVLYSLLRIEATEEVHFIGIFGMGGIGKTTIAQALFREISYMFEGSSFVKNVREHSAGKKGICALQGKMLTDVLVEHKRLIIRDPEYGADMIQERFCDKKVLIVLDDVDDVKQLEFLAARDEWFGPGSRIIITTRNEHLLSDAHAKYKPALLLNDQAVELFSMHAFRKNSPLDGYKELSDRAIRYTGGLPLALKVLGSYFRGRQLGVWKSALDRLAKIPNSEIFETLKISYDDLNVYEQKIFLDIACFFKGKEVEYVTRVLDSFGFDAVIGISVLIEKSLVTIINNRLCMHDLIQEMGLQIVRESFPNSRLRQLDEIHYLIERNKKLKEIEAIVAPYNKHDDDLHGEKLSFSPDVFENMKNLRLLDVKANFTSCEPTFLPDELQWLCWHHYPFPSLPLGNKQKLVGFEFSSDIIEHLWKGRKIMKNLKFLHLKSLQSVTKLPDVSGAPNVERLILSNCDNLVEAHESLGFLKKLVYMELARCTNLKCLPPILEMESLETLILYSCKSLEKFPEFSPCMVKLTRLNVVDCSVIKDLPSSIRYLSNLSYLSLTRCNSLTNLPTSLIELKYLRSLYFQQCPKLQRLPLEFGKMKLLCKLSYSKLSDSKLSERKQDFIEISVSNFGLLRKLDLSYRQIGEEDFLKDLHRFFNLEELILNGNLKLIQLPSSISHLSSLKQLELNECCRLQNLHGIPSGIQVLKANKCSSLEKIGDLSKESEWLSNICFFDCPKLLENEENKRYLDNILNKTFLKKCAAVDACLSIGIPGSKIPSWFKEGNHECETVVKLSPKWNNQIMGFAICVVFRKPVQNYNPVIFFNFENDEMLVRKWDVDCIKASMETTDENNGNVWIGYIPFFFFQHMHDVEDWSQTFQGNLVIDVSSFGKESLRCVAKVVYKDDVEMINQSKPSITSYWNWKLFCYYDDSIICYDRHIW